jgi:hypothetical protein
MTVLLDHSAFSMTVLLDGAHGASQDERNFWISGLDVGHVDSGEDPKIANKYFWMSRRSAKLRHTSFPLVLYRDGGR